MKLIVGKSKLKGKAAIPPSKSHTIRAVVIASLAEGKSFIRKGLASADTLSTVNCYRALGASIDTNQPDVWQITGTAGKIAIPAEPIDAGNSGTTLHIAIGSASLAEAGRKITLTGDEQIRSRPVGPLLKALTELGAHGESVLKNGKAPVVISGKLKGGRTTIECPTSQYLSSLLLAAPLALNDTNIEVTLLNEPDYVKMTLDWLDKQSIKYRNEKLKRFEVSGGQHYRGFDSVIPADFSSATFFLCAAALFGSDVTLAGLDFSDSQPDKAVVDYLREMGANITLLPEGVRIKAASLRGTEIDMNRTPDALPAMAVTAAFAEGTTRLVNVPQARIKETDRIRCMAEELRKLSVSVEELPAGLIIHHSGVKPAKLSGRGDHRIVMALAIAGLALGEKICIDTAEAMSVTFPDYVKLMKSLGANMEITD